MVAAPVDNTTTATCTIREESLNTPTSVASITIAYNSIGKLQPQIDALLDQIRPLQEIIVVDNASNDETGIFLAERYPQVTVLKMPENLGAAGAWSAGLQYALLEKRHDWAWTFDDDSIPAKNALDALLTGIEKLKTCSWKIGIVAALPFDRGTGMCYPPGLWQDGFVKPGADLVSQPVWLADLVIASGSLVRKEMVKEVGLPRADFFMDAFDFEYCLRARRYDYKIAVITDAKFTHEIGTNRQVRFLGRSRQWMNQAPWREYYISRNLTYLAWRLYPSRLTRRSIARYLAVHAVEILLFSSRKFTCLLRTVQGIRDGLHAVLGIRFRPDHVRPHSANIRPGVAENIGLEKA
jgi:GT2 family glycosyltransferase